MRGDWLFYIDDQLVHEQKNLITLGGLGMLAALFIGEQINVPFHLALGTGTTQPASTDTKLVSEALRKPVSSKTRQGNMVRLRTFFQSQEANGTWNEFGIFVAGTDEIGSGTLFNRIVPTGGISKASNQVLTIEVRITFAAG